MPFVDKDHREKPDLSIPGDLCFIEYKKLVDEWNKNPRWTTWHNITKDWFDLSSDEETAHFLAYMVAFITKCIPYEEKKRAENGDI